MQLTNPKMMIRFFTAAAFLFIIPFADASITVDGLMNDWGVLPGAYGSSDWTPSHGIYSAVEDQSPSVDFLNPGYGGQKFDVEAIYFTRDTTYAYFSIVTGFPLEGRFYQGDWYTPGDVAFDFGSDGSYEFGLETTGTNQGKIYLNPVWLDPHFVVCGPFAMSQGDLVGESIFAYDKTTYVSNTHFVFEFGIPVNYFGAFWSSGEYIPDLTIHWTMSCGNDCLNLQLNAVPHVIPEPATPILFLVGLAYLFSRKKEKT